MDPRRVYTPGALALSNLNAQIDGARAALERQPRLRDLRAALVGHLLERARFTGSVSDLDAALVLAQHRSPPREGRPSVPHVDELLLEASTLAALHRFPEALVRLDQALAQGAPLDVVQRERDTITLALGAEPSVLRAIADRRAASARQRPTHAAAGGPRPPRWLRSASWPKQTACWGAPSSPRPTCHRCPSRRSRSSAECWPPSTRATLDAGEHHYREALRLVPGFVRAAVHLAELEAERGDVAAARTRLTKALASEDPEPASRLASLTPEAPLRAELVALAGEHYRVLLGAPSGGLPGSRARVRAGARSRARGRRVPRWRTSC
jgi:hypothetical protein